MKTILLVISLALLLIGGASASSVIAVEITTTNEGTRYALNKGDRTQAAPATMEEIEAWLRTGSKDLTGPLLIYIDSRTPFQNVMELLRRSKEAGLKRFVLISTVEDAAHGGGTLHYLSGAEDDLRSFQRAPKPAVK